jgi:hypothetical protein
MTWPVGAVVYMVAIPPLIDKAEHPGERMRFVAVRPIAPRHALQLKE